MATYETIANNPNPSTLAAAMVDGSGTGLSIVSSAGYPSSGQYRILVDSEIMLVTAGQGTTTWTVARAQEGTVGAAHTLGSTVYGLLTATGLLNIASEEPGVIKMFGGSSAPTGYLLCDGSAVSRTGYPRLFTAIGTTWGAGDGSTTFNLPDLRGRSPLGAGTGSGLSARTLGQTGGEENHALSTAELAAHNHGINDSGHSHTTNQSGNPPITQYAGANNNGAGGTNHYGPDTNGTGSATTNISIQNTGSGTGHNTMHPFAVVNYIIKAA